MTRQIRQLVAFINNSVGAAELPKARAKLFWDSASV
jgi:hypothetical protein